MHVTARTLALIGIAGFVAACSSSEPVSIDDFNGPRLTTSRPVYSGDSATIAFQVFTGWPEYLQLCGATPVVELQLADDASATSWHEGIQPTCDPATLHMALNDTSAVMNGTIVVRSVGIHRLRLVFSDTPQLINVQTLSSDPFSVHFTY